MEFLIKEHYNPLGYFKHSGQLLEKDRSHNPFIVIQESMWKDTSIISYSYSLKELLGYNGSCLVLVLWKGATRSNYYSFFITDLLNYLKENPDIAEEIERL